MGDPKVQRSDSGFFTRLGRAIDAFGGDAPKAKSGPSQKQVDAVQPLPKKYKATPRRLDRSVVSAPVSDSAAYKIRENETYVANALKLVDDMRALAVKEDAWHNRTTPKDVDKVTNKYKPLMLAASGTTVLEQAQSRKQLAEMMVKELFKTPTGENLFWDLKSGHESFYRCSSFYEEEKRTVDDTCTGGTRETCSIGEISYSVGGGRCESNHIPDGDRPDRKNGIVQ